MYVYTALTVHIPVPPREFHKWKAVPHGTDPPMAAWFRQYKQITEVGSSDIAFTNEEGRYRGL